MTDQTRNDYKIEQTLRLSDLLIGVPLAIKGLQAKQHPVVKTASVVALFVGALYTLEQYNRAKAQQPEG